MAGPPSDRIRLPRLRSSGWGSSALARDCCWRQPDLAPSKRRRETAERTRTSREDETYNPSCRNRPLKVISFVSSLDAIHSVSRTDRESLHTANKQQFEKFFNHFRREPPRRVEFGACAWRRARGVDALGGDRSRARRLCACRNADCPWTKTFRCRSARSSGEVLHRIRRGRRAARDRSFGIQNWCRRGLGACGGFAGGG